MLSLCTLKTFSPRSSSECRAVGKRQRQEKCFTSAIRTWDAPGGSLQLLRETLAEVSPSSDVEVDLDLGELNIR